VGQDFSTMVFLPAQDFFGRDITVTPTKSNPSGAAYSARGIYGTGPVEIMSATGMAILSDQETILDIRDVEFFDAGQVLPEQGDLINIPADGEVPAEGDFEVTRVTRIDGGETTLSIRKYEP
jgi:hypothetical protein